MALVLPNEGYGPASRPTIRRTELFADWVEAEAYLSEEAVAFQHLEDWLKDGRFVASSDEAWQLLGDTADVFRRRQQHIGGAYPFQIVDGELSYRAAASDAYLFCLLASLPEQITRLRTAYPRAFRDLFERVVAAALRNMLPGWAVLETGWAKAAEEEAPSVVPRIAEFCKARVIDEAIFGPATKDAQVDVAAALTFLDGRNSYPIFLGQCATGVTDYIEKSNRPNLNRWGRAITFSHTPSRFFAVPFSLDTDSFRTVSAESGGLILDRTRICSALPNLADEALQGDLRGWLEAAITRLPEAA